MKIMAIDDERLALNFLKETLTRINPYDEIITFQRSSEYMKYPDKKNFEVAFIDINLGSISGIQVALDLKKYSPHCNIIFVTSYSEFAYAAIKTRPSGYVMKPYTEDDIRNELNNLRYNSNPIQFPHDKLYVHTFGNFEVYDKTDKPIRFSRTISKELFAYIIDQCGYPITTKDIAANILDIEEFDRSSSKKISQYMTDLLKDLKEAGYTDIIYRQNRQIYINKDAVDCDLYNMLSGDVSAINAYHGEYMIEYPWAEFSHSAERLKSI